MASPAPEPPIPGPLGRRPRIDGDLLVLAVAVVLINLPYLNRDFLPGHDAKSLFSMFSYFYNHVATEHELPLWMTYGSYGFKSAVPQASYLTASGYLSMAAGVLFGVRETLPLFVVSSIGDQLVLLLGITLLSRRLFSDRLTVFAVGFLAVTSTVWYWQLFFNFRIFYATPLALYFLFRFTAEKRPEYFWLTGLVVVLGGAGCPPYFYPVQALVLGLAAAGLGKAFWQALPSLAGRTWRNGAAFGLLALAAAALGFTLAQAMAGIRIVAQGRDPVTGRVMLDSFLTYGGPATTELAKSFLGTIPSWGAGPDHELTHFVGWLPLLALPVAITRCRDRHFVSLIAAALGLLMLSLGGTFACVAYGALPFLSLFRYVGYVSAGSKVLILLAAGFGIDRILAGLSSGLDRDRCSRFGLLAVLFFLLWLAADLELGGERMVAVMNAAAVGDFRGPASQDALTLGARVAAYLAAAAIALWPGARAAGASLFPVSRARTALLAALVLDGLLWQSRVVGRMPTVNEPLSFPVAPMEYHERRGLPLDESTRRKLQEWRVAGVHGAEYQMAACSVFRIDPPEAPSSRDGWTSDGLARLMKSREEVAPDPALMAVLGVTAPRLRLVPRAVYVDTVPDAEKILSRSRSLDGEVVLRQVPAEMRSSGGPDSGPLGDARVTKFSANELVARVTVLRSDPAWLVYADAVHPGWKAEVDGRPAPVCEAYLSFKAVRLEKGTHTVRFFFQDGIRTFAQKALALLAALGGLAAFAGLGWLLARPARPGPNPGPVP